MTVSPRASLRSRYDPWNAAWEEPRLAEVLADPIIQLMMGRDGVSSSLIQHIIRDACSKLRSRK